MNGFTGGIFGGGGGGPRDNRKDFDSSPGFGAPSQGGSIFAEPPSFNPMPEPEPQPYPGMPRDIGPRGGGSEPEPSPGIFPMPEPMPTPMPTPTPPAPGVTAEDLPAKPALVTELEKVLQESDVPKWVKALSKPFDAVNPADKTRLQDLIVGKDTPTGRATEVYEGDSSSEPRKPPNPPEPNPPEAPDTGFGVLGGRSENPRDGRVETEGWF